MSRRRRAQAGGGLDDPTDTVDLFPFLSIFLCIMGVLAFLQILMATMDQRKIDLVGDLSQGWEVAYKVFCLPDGVIVVPPVAGLEALHEATPEAVHPKLEKIIERRRATRILLADSTGTLPPAIEVPEAEALETLLDEILWLNQRARQTGHLYEEDVLFGIYPGGGTAYHAFREVLDTPKYVGLRVGLEALDTNWTLTVSP